MAQFLTVSLFSNNFYNSAPNISCFYFSKLLDWEKNAQILINPFLAFLGIWGMISWDQRRSGVDNQPLKGEHQLCSFSGFAFFCMLTLPLMVLKLIPQLDMFVLRPKIETTRWNVVQMFILLWLSFRVGFLFLVGFFGFWRKYTWKVTL